jgi:hypothetical protein
MKIAMLGTRRIEKNTVLITSASMLEVNALLSAQSKNIAMEPRFRRRAEDSRQHFESELDLSGERQEKQSADHAGCEQGKQDVGHSASSVLPESGIECAYWLRSSLHSQETSRRNRAFIGSVRILGNRTV